MRRVHLHAKPCDPTPRFIAPFDNDVHNLSHWVAGGEFVWDNGGKGWGTSCSATACDWQIAHDTGAGRSTSVRREGSTIYVGWCGRATRETGIDQRALTVNVPANASHVYAVYNGFSRRWTNDGGFGHVSRPATATAPGPTSVATSRTSRATT